MAAMRWRLDISGESQVSFDSRRGATSTPTRESLAEYHAPPGFPSDGNLASVTSVPARRKRGKHIPPSAVSAEGVRKVRASARRVRLKAAYAVAWRDATQPTRGLCTSALMLYMCGNSVQIFSVMTVVTVLVMHVQALLGTRALFRGVVQRDPDLAGHLLPQIAIHAFLCFVGVAAALYKCGKMGFLPTEESDWIGLLPVPVTFHAPGGLTF
jgi:Protein of unknown function (DUF1077)